MSFEVTDLIVALVISAVLLVALADFGAWTWLRRQFHIPKDVDWEQGVVSADAATDAPSADQVYFACAERLLETQLTINAALDTKTAGTVAVGSTVLPLTFGLLSLSGRTLPGATQWLLVAAVVAYVLLLMTAAWTSYIRGLEYRPELRTLRQHSQEVDGTVLRRWVAEEYALSGEINRIALAAKARRVGRTTLLLYAEGILISAAAAVALVG